MYKSLDAHVKEMKNLSSLLVKYSFPKVSPQEEEQISILKQRDIVVDGYEIIVYFSKCVYMDVDVETIHIYGKYFTFLPMSVVIKVGRKFLGNREISLMETIFYRNYGVLDENSRKIYIWTVYYKDGAIVQNPFISKFRPCSYEGFNYLMFSG